MAKKKIEKKEMIEEKIDIKEIEKEIDQYLNEKKESITEELSKKIDEQIEFKVNKRMKEEEKKYARNKTRKIIARDIVILILLAVIGYFGYCLYDVDYFNIRTKVVEKPTNKEEPKTSPKEEDNNEPPVVEDKKDSTYYIENFSYLLDNLLIEDESISSLFTSKVTKETISNEMKLKIAYKNLHKTGITVDQNMLTFSKDELLSSAKRVFGENVSLKDEMFGYNTIKFMFYNDTYLGLNEEEQEIGILNKIVDAYEEDGKITFELVIARLTNENKLVNLRNEVIAEEYHDEDLLSFQDKLTTYEVTFESMNDNYIFSSINEK